MDNKKKPLAEEGERQKYLEWLEGQGYSDSEQTWKLWKIRNLRWYRDKIMWRNILLLCTVPLISLIVAIMVLITR